MQMSIYDILTLKYPDIKIGFDQEVRLVDHMDGQGVIIQQWDYQGAPQPTKEELEAMKEDPLIKAGYQAKLNTWANEGLLKQLEAIDLKSIRALRAGDAQFLQQFEQEAEAVRAQLLPMTAAGVLAAQQQGE